MRKIDSQYKDLYRFILQQGLAKASRTDIGTTSALGGWMRFDLRDDILPITSLRLVREEKFIGEQLWFVSGDPSIKFLKDNNISIWDSWFIPGTAVYEDEQQWRPIVDVLREVFRLKMGTQISNDIVCHKLATDTGIFAFHDLLFCMGLEDGADHVNQIHTENECNGFSKEQIDAIRTRATALGVDVSYLPKKPIGIIQRIALANEMGLGEELFEYCDGPMPREEKDTMYAEVNVQLCPEFTGPWDLYQSELDHIAEWLTSKNVPTEVPAPLKPVSLQTRLNRIDKSQFGQWSAINQIVFPPVEMTAEPAPEVRTKKDVFGEDVVVTAAAVEEEPQPKHTQIEIYFEGRFQKVDISKEQADDIWEMMDIMKIPAYRLVDANIGKGGYGPQWRNWQDTQIVDGSEVELYKSKGYEYVTEVDDLDFGHRFYGKVVMHRDIDQLANMIDLLKTDPDNRRIIVSAWNPGRTWQAALPPCHLYYQCVTYEKDLRDYEEDFAKRDLTDKYLVGLTSIHEGGELDPEDPEIEKKFFAAAKAFAIENGIPTRWISMGVVLRSWDTPAGGVFNTPQYAVLLRMIAHVTNMDARELFIVGIDAHIYDNQMEAIDEVIYTDSPDDCPRLFIKRDVQSIDDFNISDFELVGYNPVPNTKVMPIAR